MFICIRIDVEKLLWLCFSATVVRDALGPYWLWPGWSGASCASWERQASWDGKHCVIIGKNMCASVACKLTKSKCECDMVACWVAEGKRSEWHKHEKMFARKRYCVPCCRAFCRRWATVDWGSVWCKTSGWWLAWLWIVRASVAFVQHCDFGCSELSEKNGCMYLLQMCGNGWPILCGSVAAHVRWCSVGSKGCKMKLESRRQARWCEDRRLRSNLLSMWPVVVLISIVCGYYRQMKCVYC